MYVCMYVCMYAHTYPQRTSVRGRDTATNPPTATFRVLVYDPGLQVGFEVWRVEHV